MTDMAAVKASSGLLYDLRGSGFDQETEARALLGLTTAYDVLFCERKRAGYEFVFAETARVRIPLLGWGQTQMNFSGEVNDVVASGYGSGDGYACTCAAFRGRDAVACQHIFWLLDQFRAQFLSHSPSPPNAPSKILLSSDGHAQGFPRIEQLLSNQSATTTIETLAEHLGWPYVCSEVEEGGMSRTQRVRDILSAFSTEILPEEFRVEPVESDSEPEDTDCNCLSPTKRRTPEQCVVQGDMEATVFQLAVHDDNVFTSLCKAMPPGACAAIYFDKILARSRSILSEFDMYCRTLGGPYEDGDKGKVLSMAAVVQTLRTNILNIHKNIHVRAPHGLQGAAKALIAILEDISTRNKDALADNPYGRVSFLPANANWSADGEDDGDSRNLYHQLIGSADGEEEEGHFVLDALADLSGKVLYPFRERLGAVLARVEVNRAPRGFIVRLAAIVRVAEGGTDMRIGITRKRSGETQDESERKRVR
ncbi:uncharacterized protein BDW70DRAFT_146960 [Aspergillus foveolatus]|uniref:uncharacterized protein n=1 Tax=Aspergillus foveolatus TaxID=210207 RepID=UPI003CCD15B9